MFLVVFNRYYAYNINLFKTKEKAKKFMEEQFNKIFEDEFIYYDIEDKNKILSNPDYHFKRNEDEIIVYNPDNNYSFFIKIIEIKDTTQNLYLELIFDNDLKNDFICFGCKETNIYYFDEKVTKSKDIIQNNYFNFILNNYGEKELENVKNTLIEIEEDPEGEEAIFSGIELNQFVYWSINCCNNTIKLSVTDYARYKNDYEGFAISINKN